MTGSGFNSPRPAHLRVRLDDLSREFVEALFWSRHRLVEGAVQGRFDPVDLLRLAPRMAPMVATHGPAGLNVAPFMVGFAVREELLGETISELRRFLENGGDTSDAARLLLRLVYDPERVDPLTLVTHLMSRGKTWENVRATGEASLGFLIPPDEGAYEVKASAEIHESGPWYEYANLLHDVMHARLGEERTHPWCPALVFRVREIYDKGYRALGTRIFPP